jgi:hypothetical protein
MHATDTVHRWEIASGKERRPLKGHQHSVLSLAFAPDGRHLASGSEDNTVLLWDTKRPLNPALPRKKPLTAGELTALWADLAADDAARAEDAIETLVAAPGQGVPFLRERLRPMKAVEPERIAKLIAALDDKQFAARQKAMQELEALRAQKEGKVRFLGYTGHKSPHIHLAMLARHEWDTVQMPVNVLDYHYRSFIRQVIPEAQKRNVGVIGMKSLGGGANRRGRFVTAKVCSVEEALNYALSQRIASLVVGIDSMDVLRQDLKIARAFPSLDAGALQKLAERVRPLAGDGRHERFKSTQHFDGIYHQRQHGLTRAEVERE